jgi:hypothetical protein
VKSTSALSLAWGLLIAAGVYSVMRAVQSCFISEPDPATVMWSAHAGFFWRALTAGYAGGMATFVIFIAIRGHEPAAARALVPAVAVAAAVVTLQGLLLP